MQRMLCWLFSMVYRRWLWNDWHQNYDTVTHVLGWRTARVVTKSGSVRCMTPCFWIFQ
jgi:hypothetical protein